MPRINLLDEATANQIAAGEVVERPASVVKELIENSFDAGATKITVEIKGAGLEQITVVDNGFGMDEIDAPLAFQRHATSKISSLSDLEEIVSMGFRGEALPSIAAVSKIIMHTRPPGAIGGTRLELHGGRIIAQSPGGCPPGTSITVQDLFFNTPARLKHVKSKAVESGQISDIVSRLAIARPDVGIKLILEGRNILHTTGADELLDTVAAVYGAKIAREMIALQNNEENLLIRGFISPPSVNRSAKRNISVIINGRFVSNYLIHTAIMEGYGTLMPKGRYPLAVIVILVDPAQLDVNVHPSKMTVRVAEENKLFNLIRRTVASVLRTDQVIPSYTAENTGQIPGQPVGMTKQQEKQDTQYSLRAAHHQLQLLLLDQTVRENPVEDLPPGIFHGPEENLQQTIISADHPSDPLADIYPIGFLPSTYILAGYPKGLVVIDHHAAHERILYEQIIALFNKEKVNAQLLMPQVVQLSPREYQVAESHIELMASLGIQIDLFGSGSFMLREVPAGLLNYPPEELLRDLLEYLLEPGITIDREKLIQKMAASAACKAAIKAGTRSSLEEAWAIIDDLKKTKVPYACPHGRPTVIYITDQELRSRFKRT